jgi:hypothetical protein
MKFGKKFLGQRIFNGLMKATFYGHFVGGKDQEALKPVVTRLQNYGVGAILDYSVEKDINENDTRLAFKRIKAHGEKGSCVY